MTPLVPLLSLLLLFQSASLAQPTPTPSPCPTQVGTAASAAGLAATARTLLAGTPEDRERFLFEAPVALRVPPSLVKATITSSPNDPSTCEVRVIVPMYPKNEAGPPDECLLAVKLSVTPGQEGVAQFPHATCQTEVRAKAVVGCRTGSFYLRLCQRSTVVLEIPEGQLKAKR